MQPRQKIRRKPPPPVDPDVVDLDARYPIPDPNDPFAPLWVLRARNSNHDLLDDPKHVQQTSPSPSVAFPLIHDHASTMTSESLSSNTTDTDNHHAKWHKRLLSRGRLTSPIPPSTSTSSSFVHVSTTSCCSIADLVPTSESDAPECALPTPSQLAHAASLPVIAASGLRVPFESLFASRPTIVVFIRHFWCPHCQDYVSTIAQTAPRPSKQHPFNLVVIGNGAPTFIPKYRALFGLEFEIYTDPTLAVYTALGMGQSSSATSTSGPSMTDGDYIRHGTMSGIAKVVLRALKAGLPVWERGGDIHQLGGEFILGPGLTCSYAHRMQTPKGHAPIRAVLSAAGVDVPPESDSHSPDTPPTISSSSSTPKLFATLRKKGWVPQKRSSSFGLAAQDTNTPASTSTLTRSKSKANRWKNLSIRTYPILGQNPSQTKTRPESSNLNLDTKPSPSPSSSSNPINEFGVWRRTGRISLDSSRVLSEGVRSHPNSLATAYHRDPPTSPYHHHHHRQYASTATLPLSFSLPLLEKSKSKHKHKEKENSWPASASAVSIAAVPEDQEDWMRERMSSLEIMRERKRERRAGFVGYYIPSTGTGADGRRSVSLGGPRRPGSSGMESVKETEEEPEEIVRWDGRELTFV